MKPRPWEGSRAENVGSGVRPQQRLVQQTLPRSADLTTFASAYNRSNRMAGERFGHAAEITSLSLSRCPDFTPKMFPLRRECRCGQ